MSRILRLDPPAHTQVALPCMTKGDEWHDGMRRRILVVEEFLSVFVWECNRRIVAVALLAAPAFLIAWPAVVDSRLLASGWCPDAGFFSFDNGRF